MELQPPYETLSTKLHDVTTNKAPILIDTVVTVLITSQLWVQFCRCRWPCGLRCRSVATRLQGSWIRNPLIAWMLYLVFVVQVAACVTGLSLIQGSLSGCVCVCVISKPQQCDDLGPSCAVAARGKKNCV